MTALLLATLGRVLCAVGWHRWRDYVEYSYLRRDAVDGFTACCRCGKERK